MTAERRAPSRGAAEADTGSGTASAEALMASNLTYTTVDACRTFDSRLYGGPFGRGAGYSLDMVTPCGLPTDGSVRAVMANVISVDARGTGYLRAAPYESVPTSSGATVLNFNNGLVSSNAVPLSLCDPATTTCTWDLDIWIPNNSRSNIVLDVVGYFS